MYLKRLRWAPLKMFTFLFIHMAQDTTVINSMKNGFKIRCFMFEIFPKWDSVAEILIEGWRYFHHTRAKQNKNIYDLLSPFVQCYKQHMSRLLCGNFPLPYGPCINRASGTLIWSLLSHQTHLYVALRTSFFSDTPRTILCPPQPPRCSPEGHSQLYRDELHLLGNLPKHNL
jgi:hypothetical protein